MPSAQVIDLSPIPRTEETPLEKMVGAYSKKSKEIRDDKRDTDALKKIYSQYQQDGQNIQKAIQDISTDPDVSPTTRVNTMQQLLGFHEYNQELQKKERADSEKKEKNRAKIADLELRRGLEAGALSPYEDDPKMAEQVSRPAKEKAPPGGLSGIPLTQEESKSISNVLKNNPNASAEELEVAFNDAGIVPGRTKEILESRRRKEEYNQKKSNEEKKLTRDEELEFHRESAKYEEELIKNTKIAKNQVNTIKDIEKAIDSGNVKPTTLANIFRGFGEVGDKVARALVNKDEASLQASIPALLEGWKEVFGVRLSDADLKVLQDKLPDMGKSPEANRAIVKVLKKYSKNTLLRSRIAKDIKSENRGLRPLGYADKIEERFDKMTTPVRVINPDTGNIIEIPAYEVSDAIESGAQLYNEGSDNG